MGVICVQMLFKATGLDDLTYRVTGERTEERKGRSTTAPQSVPKI